MKHTTLLSLLLLSPAWAGQVASRSEYTSLASHDCKVVERGHEDERSRCPGRDGYEVYHQSAEAESWLVLKKGEVELRVTIPENFPSTPLNGAFVSGEKLEWRYKVRNGRPELVGLIHRVRDQNRAENRSLLFIVRLQGNKVCPLGFAETNEKARSLADGEKTCP